jgi:hypothetical protein
MSQQEINLYQPTAKGVRGALSASSTSTSLLVVCATLASLWGFAYWQTQRLEKVAQVVRAQQQAQAALSAAQGPQLAALSDEDLDALLAKLNSDYDYKSRALALLNCESQQRVGGFSSRLRAFAARHIDGVWLDRLMLGANVESVSVSGSTLSPDSVPRYLRSLAQDPALKGGQIDEFIIERPKADKAAGGRLSFHAGHRGLATPVAKEEGDS